LNTIDLQFMVEMYPVSNSKIKAKRNGIYIGGPATNAAITYAWLGGKTVLITPVGEHLFTGLIYNELENFNVDVIDPAESLQLLPTFASIITEEHSGDRTVFSYFPEDAGALQPSMSPDYISTMIYDFDIVLIDGFHINHSLNIIKFAREYNIPVVFDGGSWKEGMEKLLPYTDIMICSESFNPPGIIGKSGLFDFLKRYGIGKGAVTRGDKSVIYYEGNNEGEVETESVHVVDTLGAGDVFHGAFCFYYTQKADFAGALQQASIIAAESCKYYGTREWMKEIKK